MASQIPKSTRALVLRKSARKPTYHDAVIEQMPLPSLAHGQILVQINAAGFNRRDVCSSILRRCKYPVNLPFIAFYLGQLWQRLGLYPGLDFGSTIGADGAGVVIAASDPHDPLLHKRVLLAPMRGWNKAPNAPESNNFRVIGATKGTPGTFARHVVIDRDQVVLTPDHLDDVHAAALSLGALTAWRACFVNGGVTAESNVLITGIGGGVALLALQLCVAAGAHVWVTGGSPEKIKQAQSFGAKGGVSYKSKNWPQELATLAGSGNNPLLDVVVDSAGGDIMGQVSKILKSGGKVVCYGMTAQPVIKFTMREVLRNQRLIGSTMGSLADLRDVTAFVAKHRIIPHVSKVIKGLEEAELGFEEMKNDRGSLGGKVVIDLDVEGAANPPKSKL